MQRSHNVHQNLLVSSFCGITKAPPGCGRRPKCNLIHLKDLHGLITARRLTPLWLNQHLPRDECHLSVSRAQYSTCDGAYQFPVGPCLPHSSNTFYDLTSSLLQYFEICATCPTTKRGSAVIGDRFELQHRFTNKQGKNRQPKCQPLLITRDEARQDPE